MPITLPLYTIYALGEKAVTVNFSNEIKEEVNKLVLALFQKIKDLALPFIVDVLPAYSSLTIHYDVLEVLKLSEKNIAAFEVMTALIENLIVSLKENPKEAAPLIRVAVCYAYKYAPDIESLAYAKELTVEEVIQIHTSKIYRVYMIGFQPGFPYMGEVDQRITISRKEQPRIRVEGGSVGVAGKQTGIYPQVSPGGWQIIGRTPMSLFDATKQEPTLLKPGDRVQFYPITEDEFESYKNRGT